MYNLIFLIKINRLLKRRFNKKFKNKIHDRHNLIPINRIANKLKSKSYRILKELISL